MPTQKYGMQEVPIGSKTGTTEATHRLAGVTFGEVENATDLPKEKFEKPDTNLILSPINLVEIVH